MNAEIKIEHGESVLKKSDVDKVFRAYVYCIVNDDDGHYFRTTKLEIKRRIDEGALIEMWRLETDPNDGAVELYIN